jgi:hypothetical protein
MGRHEDFFNEATRLTRDSYVFQSDGICSDDDVRDIAISLAEFGYTYAVDKVCDILNHYCNRTGVHPSRRVDMIDHIRKAMKE